MNKIQNLKTVWKKLRDAKQVEKESLNKIFTSYCETREEKKACLRQENIGSEREPLLVFCRCDNFNRDESCANANCTFVEQNNNFVMRRKERINIRREFIKGLFSRTK